MRILWTLFKVILGLAIAIPLGILALALTAGLVGTLVVLALLVLKVACLALVGYGAYRLGRLLFAPARKGSATLPELSAPDPYYQAAVRELDAELARHGN